MSRLANDRLLRPQDMVDNDLGVGLVYPQDDRFQRLDLWLADQAGNVPAAVQLSVLRQVAEAVAYAHRNRVAHRGLTPHAVSVRHDRNSAAAMPRGPRTRLTQTKITITQRAAGECLPSSLTTKVSAEAGQESQRELCGAWLMRLVKGEHFDA